MTCRICGGGRVSKDKRGHNRCKDCANRWQRERQATMPDTPEWCAVMSRQEIADEMFMRGFPMSKETVRQIEKRALMKLQRLWKWDFNEFAV